MEVAALHKQLTLLNTAYTAYTTYTVAGTAYANVYCYMVRVQWEYGLYGFLDFGAKRGSVLEWMGDS